MRFCSEAPPRWLATNRAPVPQLQTIVGESEFKPSWSQALPKWQTSSTTLAPKTVVQVLRLWRDLKFLQFDNLANQDSGASYLTLNLSKDMKFAQSSPVGHQ